ncbi:hypothetical protein [Intestinicryptomonas porci]|uniref:Uncharacterized protein n=1 Tax=Intestinicryptomonas porci TaxID=2926320 RepID=A0ABU4WEA5_9BACT|nr:hypothetical protein [Opitutales bacterium CLA-KB-P66]
MKKSLFIVFIMLCCVFSYASEYNFRLPVEGNVYLQEGADSYIVKILLKRTKTFSPAQNKQVDYSHSEVILNKALAAHLKVQKGYGVSYSGRKLLNTAQDGNSNAVFVYEIPKGQIAVQKLPEEFFGGENAPKIKSVRDMHLMGYFLRYKSDVIALINSYQDSLFDIIDKLDTNNVSFISLEFKKVYKEAAESFDEEKLKHKYNSDPKLMISDVKTLMNLSRDASKNFKTINAIFEKQCKIVAIPFSDSNEKEVMNLLKQVEELKKNLIEIKD